VTHSQWNGDCIVKDNACDNATNLVGVAFTRLLATTASRTTEMPVANIVAGVAALHRAARTDGDARDRYCCVPRNL